MRVVVQKVSQAAVEIEGEISGSIGAGLCILIAVAENDTLEAMQWMANKLINLRVFPDDDGKMNRSVIDIQGGLLVISNFTLYGDARKGTRPSYSNSAPPSIAEPIYDKFIEILRASTDLQVETGKFGAMMDVSLVNDGPVTLIIDK